MTAMGRWVEGAFVPPGQSKAAYKVLSVTIPLVRRYWARVQRVDLSPESWRRLAASRDRPTILCANHPSLAEPSTLFSALDRAGLRANYMMSREVLDAFGPVGPVLVAGGGYTVRRGTVDRKSLACTRRLLAAGRQVMILPEGETYGLNDTLIPFREGVSQIGMWALSDRISAGLAPDVRLLPMAVKYLYTTTMDATIERQLAQAENYYGVAAPGRDLLDRLDALLLAFLTHAERDCELPVRDDLPAAERLAEWYTAALAKLTVELGAEAPLGTRPEQLRRLYAEFDELDRAAARWPWIERQLSRLQRFQAVYVDYVRELPSVERVLDVLGRYDVEMRGQWRPLGWTAAQVAVGQQIPLGASWSAYQSDRRQAVKEVTHELQQQVRHLLGQLPRTHLPLCADPK